MEKIFKAKRLDNGKWIIFELDDLGSCNGRTVHYETGAILDLDTVCQYTGINDSEGNRIFEGDEFTNFTYAKMYKGSFVVDCGCDGFYLYDEAKNLTLTGHNIHDRG